MAAYRLRIGASGPPAPDWRLAMTDTNTLYEVGSTPAASGLTAKYTYPSGSIPSNWGGVTANLLKHGGYGSVVHIEDAGTHGTLVFNETGEDVFENDISCFTISADSPVFDVWQQANYCTSEAQAIAQDVDWYWSATAATDVPAPNRVTTGWPTGWAGDFPVSIGDWVIRRKQTDRCLWPNQPHFFRFGTAAYVPASITGTGAGALVCNSGAFSGPFTSGGGGWKPPGITAAQWTDDLDTNSNRKMYAYVQNTSTRAWSKLASSVPAMSYYDELSSHIAGLDKATERLYYLAQTTPNASLYYLDLSSGIAGATFSAAAQLTGTQFTPAITSISTGPVVTNNHPTGKRLWYFRAIDTNTLGMIDLATGISYSLDLAAYGLDFGSTTWTSLGYDSTNNVVILTSGANGVSWTTQQFTVPSDPTSAANYTVTGQTLALASGVSYEAAQFWGFGERGKYHEGLGCIIIPQRTGKVLAYVPA